VRLTPEHLRGDVEPGGDRAHRRVEPQLDDRPVDHVHRRLHVVDDVGTVVPVARAVQQLIADDHIRPVEDRVTREVVNLHCSLRLSVHAVHRTHGARDQMDSMLPTGASSTTRVVGTSAARARS
jgi:hypothetical protein